MRERISLILILICLAISVSNSVLASDQQWLHVRVVEDGDSDGNVSLNLPVEMIATMIEGMENEVWENGDLSVNDLDFDHDLLAIIVKSTIDSEDGEFVKIEDDGEIVSVAKKGDNVLVNITEDDEEVKIKVPVKVLKALVSGDDQEELDVAAGLRALANQGGNTLVTVESDDGNIRIWVDSSMQGI